MARYSILKSLGKLASLPGKRPLSQLSERELIQRESEIGRQIFGTIKKGHRREFFNTSPKVWIWHEEWLDSAGKRHQLTTKYEIRDHDIWKVQPGPRYTKLSGDELTNFKRAVEVYFERVMREIYDTEHNV